MTTSGPDRSGASIGLGLQRVQPIHGCQGQEDEAAEEGEGGGGGGWARRFGRALTLPWWGLNRAEFLGLGLYLKPWRGMEKPAVSSRVLPASVRLSLASTELLGSKICTPKNFVPSIAPHAMPLDWYALLVDYEIKLEMKRPEYFSLTC